MEDIWTTDWMRKTLHAVSTVFVLRNKQQAIQMLITSYQHEK